MAETMQRFGKSFRCGECGKLPEKNSGKSCSYKWKIVSTFKAVVQLAIYDER